MLIRFSQRPSRSFSWERGLSLSASQLTMHTEVPPNASHPMSWPGLSQMDSLQVTEWFRSAMLKVVLEHGLSAMIIR